VVNGAIYLIASHDISWTDHRVA